MARPMYLMMPLMIAVAAIWLLLLPSALASHEITAEGCVTWNDHYDGELPAWGVAVQILEWYQVNGEWTSQPLAPPAGSLDDFITDLNGCWKATFSTAAAVEDEPLLGVDYYPSSFSGVELNVSAYRYDPWLEEAYYNKYRHSAVAQVTTSIDQYLWPTKLLDQQNEMEYLNRTVIRAHQHASHAQNWTNNTLGVVTPNVNVFAFRYPSANASSSPGSPMFLWGTVEAGTSIIGHEFGHRVLNGTSNGRHPEEAKGNVDMGAGWQRDRQHGDYFKPGYHHPRCSEADLSGAWSEGFSDYIGGLWYAHYRSGSKFYGVFFNTTGSSTKVFLDMNMNDPSSGRVPSCPAASGYAGLSDNNAMNVAGMLWHLTSSSGEAEAFGDVSQTLGSCSIQVNSSKDFLECAYDVVGKPLSDSVVRSAWKNNIDYLEPVQSTLHNRTPNPNSPCCNSIWVRGHIQFDVEAESRLNYIELAQVRYPNACGSGGSSQYLALDVTDGNHKASPPTYDDPSWTVVDDTWDDYPAQIGVYMSMCMEASTGLKTGAYYEWGTLETAPWWFHLDNQDPWVDLQVRWDDDVTPPGAAGSDETGVWMLNWTAHDHTGSGLCCNVTIYVHEGNRLNEDGCFETKTHVDGDDEVTTKFINPESPECPVTPVCHGPYDSPDISAQGDPQAWVAYSESESGLYPGEINKTYTGGCIYAVDDRDDLCFLAVVEDSAREDFDPDLNGPGQRGNMGYEFECNRQKSTPGAIVGAVVLVLVVATLWKRRTG